MLVSRISCAIAGDCLPDLACRNWVEAPDVNVSFDIHHRGTSILLKYRVTESQVRAVHTGFHKPVWEDSCVEFFISLPEDPAYYNFEFNAIGAILGAYGPDRNQREPVPVEFLECIQIQSSLGTHPFESIRGIISWELDIVLPVTLFHHHEIRDIAGTHARGNFYKCGDKLDRPHYLSWQPVGTEKPDFHRPEFFGDLEFSL
jgi:hypothetical protein